LISKSNDGSTPIIIHRILKDKSGLPKHKFEFKDPDTSAWLPSYKPVLKKDVHLILGKQPLANVFYLDRYNRGAIDLAKANKELGATVFFEPSSISDENLFEECLKISDIVKFSNERIPNYSELYPVSQTTLEIETLGSEGLRYRYSPDKIVKSWKKVPAYKTNRVLDAAGAGDWCSAGIIYTLKNSDSLSFHKADIKEIEASLKYGQILGAINCAFDGARGLMYEVEKEELENTINVLMKEDYLDLDKISFSKRKLTSKRKPIKISSLY
jgi:fructokinase